MRSLLTGLNLVTSTWRSRRYKPRKVSLSRAGQHTCQGRGLDLVVPVRRRQPPPAPVQVHHTVLQQRIVQVVCRQQVVLSRQSRHFQSFQTNAFFLVSLPSRQEKSPEPPDLSRPTYTARRLLRLFSMESARRQFQPFYSRMVRSVLREEQERYRSRPTQAISLIWNLFGRQQAFRTLTRFYLSAVERLGTNYYPALHDQNSLYLAAGVLLHSQVYQRYVRRLWNRDPSPQSWQYARQEQTVTDEVLKLQVARRILPSREEVERLVETQPAPKRPAPSAPARQLRLSESDLRALVQGVSTTLERRERLEALRKGENVL